LQWRIVVFRRAAMPKSSDLADLFRALSTGDLDSAVAIAARICRDEDRRGHRGAARLLREALRTSSNGSVPMSGAVSSATSFPLALKRATEGVKLANVDMGPGLRDQLENVVAEWKQRSRLRERGLAPRAKLLFHGPPGCGKSLTALALGAEMGLPVFVVRFDAIIGAYLGQTATRLRQIFAYTEETPCVLVFDELDALGKRRGNPLDVGELDRIVIALMQELEHSRPRGLIVGATNLSQHLDEALWRRFELSLSFPAPSRRILAGFARRESRAMGLALPPACLRDAASAPSFAVAREVILQEARRQALSDGGRR